MNTFMAEKRKIRDQQFREAAARSAKINQAREKAHRAAGLVLAGLHQLQAAHKEIEIRQCEADHAYYNLLDGQPGTRKLEHLKANLKKYRQRIKPQQLIVN